MCNFRCSVELVNLQMNRLDMKLWVNLSTSNKFTNRLGYILRLNWPLFLPAQVRTPLSYYPVLHEQIFPDKILKLELEHEVQAPADPQQVEQV